MNYHIGRFFASFVVSGLSFLATNAFAHHSQTMYDKHNPIELHGVVKRFEYTNLHAWLIIDVTNEDGSVTTWGVEWTPGGPSSLRKVNIRKGDFQPGTEVIVKGHPMKDGRPALRWIQVTRKKDGKKFSEEDYHRK